MSSEDGTGVAGAVVTIGVIYWVAMGITLFLVFAVVAAILISVFLIGTLVYYLANANYPQTLLGWLMLFFGATALIVAPFAVMTFFVFDGDIFGSVPYDQSPILPPICFFWLIFDIYLVGLLHEWCADNH